ncbi:DUF397 domain-containing protein [Marinactinospora thermotolerans]|uniref:DUF397 domain-containing protein n=1 Tax=Marinactinospora thermotolerans DSM 45154 TaxID=1122192 RepID=A0A1T4TGD2_9ACTN|nr:DUF397 domain-containing protein [Marinactinospora thermotolerans]SKA39545.1 protein of unknown function [Marinactinospora thermotolerans DSM 45154]
MDTYLIPSSLFRKSSYSSSHGQNCVEVADLPGAAAVRDSQNPHAGHLVFPATEMTAFLDAVKTGRL